MSNRQNHQPKQWARAGAAFVLGCSLFGGAAADSGAATWEQLSAATPQVAADVAQTWAICACFLQVNPPVEFIFIPGPGTDMAAPLSLVPEPGSVALMALGLAAVARVSRAAQRKR